MQRLGLTLLMVLLPLVAASLGLGGYLNYASVRNSYLEMVGERLETVAHRIAGDAQIALSMGMPLGGQDALERTLVRERDADSDLASVDVVSNTGLVLFSSDPSRKGNQDVPDVSLAERRTADIVSPFETVDGTVVVRASREAIDGALNRLGRQILITVVIATIASALAVALVVTVAVRTLYGRLMDRRRTSAGRAVPAEMLEVIDAVDAAHRSIAERLAKGAKSAGSHASL
ncbi:hypothetical protein [Acuticoccus kandeliae]|uniref:hypothetical protein n=1 Tax=Acuticoccus kandeliae TaxID=2073160 RepID=UPI001300BB41|nr:hypothetical protein [Acuticoccus kandeliae]